MRNASAYVEARTATTLLEIALLVFEAGVGVGGGLGVAIRAILSGSSKRLKSGVSRFVGAMSKRIGMGSLR